MSDGVSLRLVTYINGTTPCISVLKVGKGLDVGVGAGVDVTKPMLVGVGTEVKVDIGVLTGALVKVGTAIGIRPRGRLFNARTIAHITNIAVSAPAIDGKDKAGPFGLFKTLTTIAVILSSPPR